MQIKTQTDYAIRILIFLAEHRYESTVGKEIAVATGISENYLPRIIRYLRNAGWVSSTSGVVGGYKLIVNPAKITLLNVVEATNENFQIGQAPKISDTNAVEVSPFDAVHEIYQKLQETAEQQFNSVTIEDMLTDQ